MNAGAVNIGRPAQALEVARQILTIEGKLIELQKERDRLQAEFCKLIPDEVAVPAPVPVSSLSDDEEAFDLETTDSTVRVKVEQYIADRPTVKHDALRITKELDILPDTVRSILSALFRDGKIKRPSRGIYVAIPGVTGKD
jgi:hypothetical protein